MIYVVQHGDKERMPGDPGLTELGQDQASAAARWLSGMGPQSLFSSPLRRARETAAAIAAVTGLPVQLDDRLRERLNWDGTQTFDAFRRTGIALPVTGTMCWATASPRARRGSG